MTTIHASDVFAGDPTASQAASEASGNFKAKALAVILFAPRQVRRAAVGTKNFVVDHRRGIGYLGLAILAIAFVVGSWYITIKFLSWLYVTNQVVFWVVVGYYAFSVLASIGILASSSLRS